MKKALFTVISLLWLIAFLPKADSQSKHHLARQEKHSFVYVLTGQDVRIYRVSKNGTLQIVCYDGVRIGQLPRCLLATPNGLTLYVASDADTNDYHSGLVYAFTIQKNGLLMPLGGWDAGCMPFHMTLSPSGAFLYCATSRQPANQCIILSYHIKPDGSLTPLLSASINLGNNFVGSLIMAPSGK